MDTVLGHWDRKANILVRVVHLVDNCNDFVQVLLLYPQKITNSWEVFLKDNRAPILSNLGPQLCCVFWAGLRYGGVGFRVVVAATVGVDLVAVAVNASVDVASVRIASCEFAKNL